MVDVGFIPLNVAERLEKAGIRSLELLAATPPLLIAEVAGLREDEAVELCREARNTLGLGFTTALEYLERRKSIGYITTGSKALDDLLGGGVETKSITELCGEYGVGKTQLCHQLCVTVQLPLSRGGLDASALYLDTEGTFRPERLIEIASRFGLDPKEALNNIIYARVYNSDHQVFLVEEASKVIEEKKIKLLVIDSLVGHFRGEFCGRETLAERQQRLNRHIHQLLRLADVYNLAVVVTNQVLSVPDSLTTFPLQRPVGGNVVAHGCTYRLWLRKLHGHRRAAKIFDSPGRPEAECFFAISGEGIKDLEDHMDKP
ncbi:MAG: DNA repair and recombination protein RadA [Thermoprotei archaeon]|nr:MAG: DNA repair and recombination protein RadA [Thermoprotei archaeon]